jgi:hypothetical protein
MPALTGCDRRRSRPSRLALLPDASVVLNRGTMVIGRSNKRQRSISSAICHRWRQSRPMAPRHGSSLAESIG